MTSSSFRRKIFIFLLAGVLAASWGLAEEPRNLPGPDRAGTFAWAPLDLLSRFWSALTALWGESGCTLDPSGACITSPGDGTSSGTAGDEGCTLDPNGRCLGGS